MNALKGLSSHFEGQIVIRMEVLEVLEVLEAFQIMNLLNQCGRFFGTVCH
jgi:hypothetical protein